MKERFAVIAGREIFRDIDGQLIDASDGNVLDGELRAKAAAHFERVDARRKYSEAVDLRNDPLAGEVFAKMRKGIESGDFDAETLDSDPDEFIETFDALKGEVLKERRAALRTEREKRAKLLRREINSHGPETVGGRESNFQKYVELLSMSDEFSGGLEDADER